LRVLVIGGTRFIGKRAAELTLWSTLKGQRPFPFTVIRPTVVEGPEDPSGRAWFWVQRVADGQEVLVPQTVPTTIFRHVYVDDVAEAFVRATLNPRAFWKAYNVAGEEIVSLEDYARVIAHELGQEAAIASAPLKRIQRRPDLSDFQAPFVGERFVPDIARVKEDLSLELTPLGSWMRQTASWFVENCREDSKGYDKRAAEVAAARTWLEGIR